MASGNVVIRFVTGFVGKGFDMLKSAIGSISKQGLRAIGSIAGAMGDMASTVSKQIGGLIHEFGNFGKMVAQGGVWGAMTFAVTTVGQKIIERMEAAKEASKAAAKATAEHFQSAADAVAGRFKKVLNAISSAASKAKALLGARSAGYAANESEAVAGISAKEREALAGAKDDGERAIIRANAALEKAKVQAAERTRKAADDLSEAENDVRRAEQGVAAAQAAYDKLLEERNRIFSEWNALNYRRLKGEDVDEQMKTLEAASVKADKELVDANERLAEARRGAELAEIAQNAAYQKNRQAATEAAEQVAAAEFGLAEAERAAAKAAKEKAKNDAEAAAKAAEEAEQFEAGIQAEQDRLDAEGALAETYEALAEQAKDRLKGKKAGMADLDKKIGELDIRIKEIGANASLVNGAMSRFGKSTGRGGFLFADWQKAHVRQEDAEKADGRADAKSLKRYERLAKRRSRGVHLSRKDARFVSDWEAYADAKAGSSDLERQKSELEKQRDGLRKEAVSLLKEINENLRESMTVE